MLTQVFGSTTFALSALLTAFMTGLALGSEWAGRRAERIARPLRLYGLLEVGIGLYALAVPTMLSVLPGVYRPLFQSLQEDFTTFSLLRFALVLVILLAPTAFMGATLPLLAEHVARIGGDWEGSSGLLYGVNMLGACTGTLLCGFLLLPQLGLTTTNLAVALLNMALGTSVVVVEALSRPSPQSPRRAPEDEVVELGDEGAEDALPPWMVRAILVCFALAGGISMTYQVLWTRAYVIILGSSTYSFTLILSTFLIGLAGGSALMSAMLKRVRRPVFLLAAAQIGVCVFGAVCFFTLNKVPGLLFEHMRREAGSPANVYIYNIFLIALVVLAPTLLQGMSFPLVVRIVSRAAQVGRGGKEAEADPGRLVGRAYAINTVGAIVGSFASGFIWMPLMGLRWSVGLAIALNLAVGVALALMSARLGGARGKLATLAPLVVVAASLFVLGPQLDLTRLSSGAFRVYWARELFTRESFERDDPEVLFYRDGVAATITVEKRGHLITLKSNGKPEASNDADMATQILVGLLPMVMHEQTRTARAQIAEGRYEGVREVAMVGFGSGVTAGASLTWPLERLDVVEIEAAMLGASEAFNAVNHAPLTDPRIRVFESDGRNFLEYTDGRYDAIISEPSNPWIAGVASLFTREHFERARLRLKPGGLFCQWVQLYELRPENVNRIFKTFRAVFPHVHIVSSMAKGTDLILIGSNEPLAFTAEGPRRAFGDPSVAAELRRAGVESADDLLALTFLGEQELGPFIEAQEAALGHPIVLNTDDNGILEFEAPRDLIQYKEADAYFAGIYYGDVIYGDPRRWLEGYEDASVWTADRLAALAMSTFVMGKQRLAGELAREAQRRGPTRLGQQVEAAWTIYDGGPGRHVLDLWPIEGGSLRPIIASGLEQQAPIPALEVIYAREPRDGDAFERSEATLAAALFLFETRDFKQALWQLDRLKRQDPALSRTPAAEILRGFTVTRRRRYQEAFAHFLAFYEGAYERPLAEPCGPGLAPGPHPAAGTGMSRP